MKKERKSGSYSNICKDCYQGLIFYSEILDIHRRTIVDMFID
jgi:hypothetical protein